VSDHWVPAEEVDLFKDEVRPRVRSACMKSFYFETYFLKPAMQTIVDADPTDDWEDIEDQTSSLPCIDHWRNAGPEEWKRMFALFKESGIFIVSCRHQMVLLACDMIKSGELYVVNCPCTYSF
jgi:hypothetical protein